MQGWRVSFVYDFFIRFFIRRVGSDLISDGSGGRGTSGKTGEQARADEK